MINLDFEDKRKALLPDKAKVDELEEQSAKLGEQIEELNIDVVKIDRSYEIQVDVLDKTFQYAEKEIYKLKKQGILLKSNYLEFLINMLEKRLHSFVHYVKCDLELKEKVRELYSDRKDELIKMIG